MIITCLFCNKPTHSVSICLDCAAHYFMDNLSIIYLFKIYLNNYCIIYYPKKYVCDVYHINYFDIDYKKIINNIPMEKFLLPPVSLKDKINNLMAYI